MRDIEIEIQASPDREVEARYVAERATLDRLASVSVRIIPEWPAGSLEFVEPKTERRLSVPTPCELTIESFLVDHDPSY